MFMKNISASFFSSFFKNEALNSTAIVSGGIFLASIINYFFQILVARNTSVHDFGDFTALLSLSAIFLVPANAIMAASIKEVTQIIKKDNNKLSTRFFLELTILTMLTGFFVASGVFLFSSYAMRSLKIENIFYVYSFCFMMLFSYVIVVPNTYLQAYLRFTKFSISTATAAVFRFALPLTLLFLGFGVSGLFVGMGIALLASFLFGSALTMDVFKEGFHPSSSGVYKSLLKTSLSALLLNLGMTMLNNVDVIFVKYRLSSLDAGTYAGLVTVGKVFLFGAGSIALIMYPQISNAYALGKGYIRKLKLFTLIQLFLVIGGLIVFSLFPEMIIKVMFGDSFLGAAKYLPMFSVFTALYILSNFAAYFLLAVSLNKMFVVQVLAGILQVILLSFCSSIDSVIKSNIIVALFLLSGLILYYKLYARIDNSPSI